MGVKNVVKKIGNKAGDRVAKLATLSPVQVEEVQLKRENYLLEMPNPNDSVARSTTERMMAASSIEIFNAFLPQIKDLYVPVQRDAEYDSPFSPEHNIKYINITKWVTDKKENNLEKLVNVYAVLSNEDCNIALVFNRTQKGTNVYLAVVNTQNASNNRDAGIFKDRLIEAIRGNFPGAEMGEGGLGILPCMKENREYSVATASNIPTEKSEKFVSQTIEKLLDGIVPDSKKKEYTIVLLATPILDVEERKLKLGEFYSGLAPYAQWQTQFTYTENNSVGSSATVGVNVGASAGIQNGQNYSTTDTDSTTDSESTTNTENSSQSNTEGTSVGESESNAHADGTSTTDTTTTGTNGSKGVSETTTTGSSQGQTVTEGESSGSSWNAGLQPFGIGGGGGHNWGTNSSVADATTTMENLAKGTTENSGWSNSVAQALGKTATDTITKGVTNTISSSVAKTTGTAVANTLGKAVTTAMSKTSGITKGTSLGANFGANFARSSTVTAMIGKNESISQTFSNFNIKHALELLESQMKRLEQSTALGMWDFAAYVVSEDQDVANNVAHSYLALTLGEESYMSKSAINVWRGKVEEEKDRASEIFGYLQELRHPVFGLNPGIVEEDSEFNEYPSIVTATTSLSGKELAYSLNFPQKSITGLPVLESAEFGRSVVTYDEMPDDDVMLLGKISHMRHIENTKVELGVKSLASHTFITGSTGSGKSNTVYQMLNKCRKKGIKFLVVEPAKGEYKNIFGNAKDVYVYGTNPLITPLLRINPFSFPKSIHVLEHMDRLIEIFNVCWPMYAAMPAVLKAAVEKAYENCGWDLVKSENKYGEDLYPSFYDVAKNVKIIIDSSEYDNENKGAYKGSLLTRLESLSNGINGMIFAADEIDSELLFDKNVIVDLSRVGSTETKSLIMGMLVLKLQEYRMAYADGMNSDLSHMTVLEEAHNLLRRTSTEQSMDGANLVGKSVEMLSNAIAEMRTYGEGFIIADQAPGLMDMSVIRNTNTKIIMRLPDQADRELVGKAANLNDDQISELAKLPCGVAAIYQNEWVQPVLCKVDYFDTPEKTYQYDPSDSDYPTKKDEELLDSLLDAIMNKELFRQGDKTDLKKLKALVIKSKLSSTVKSDFLEYISEDNEDALKSLRALVYDFLSAENAIIESRQCNDITEWVKSVVGKLNPSLNGYSNKQIDLAMALILYEQAERDVEYNNLFCKFTELYQEKGGVL